MRITKDKLSFRLDLALRHISTTEWTLRENVRFENEPQLLKLRTVFNVTILSKSRYLGLTWLQHIDKTLYLWWSVTLKTMLKLKVTENYQHMSYNLMSKSNTSKFVTIFFHVFSFKLLYLILPNNFLFHFLYKPSYVSSKR